jgi:hypothetical protein
VRNTTGRHKATSDQPHLVSCTGGTKEIGNQKSLPANAGGAGRECSPEPLELPAGLLSL